MNQMPGSTGSHRPAVATGAGWRAERSGPRIPVPGQATEAGAPGTRACGPRHLAPVTIDRLVRCHRLCVRLQKEGRESVSSRELGELLGCRPSLIRKDFSRLGTLGTRGHGYRVAELLCAFEELLGGGEPTNVVLIGTGVLGAALLTHGAFARDGFRFVAAFDFDPSRAGTRCDGLVVNHVSRMSDVLGALSADIGVLAVTETEAQDAAELLAENGVRAILNLTPAILLPRESVVVTNVDVATELTKLAFYAADAQRGSGRDDAAPGNRRDRADPRARRLRGRRGDVTGPDVDESRGRNALAIAGGTGQ